jgi:hypothetical protein
VCGLIVKQKEAYQLSRLRGISLVATIVESVMNRTRDSFFTDTESMAMMVGGVLCCWWLCWCQLLVVVVIVVVVVLFAIVAVVAIVVKNKLSCCCCWLFSRWRI